jgi:hypothetical protein
MRRSSLIAATILALGASASPAQAATRLVATGGSNTGNCLTSACQTVQYAISQAGSGDTIQIAAGTYPETLNVTKDVTLAGVGPQTFIDGNGAAAPGPGIDIANHTVTLQNLHVRGGLDPAGGGDERSAVLSSSATPSKLTIVGCTLDQAPASSPALAGAAIQFDASTTLSISSSTVSGFDVGIGTQASSTLTIASSSVNVPLTSAPGGDIALTLDDSATTITDSTIGGDTAIDDDDGNLTLTRSVVHARTMGVIVRDDFEGPEIALRDSVVAPGAGELDTAIQVNGTGASGTVRPALALVGDTILARSNGGAVGIDTTIAKADTTVFMRNTILRAIDPGSGTNEHDIATGATNPIRWDLGFSAFTTTTGPAIPLPGSDTNIAAVPHFVDDTGADLHLASNSTLFDAGDAAQVQAGEEDVAGASRALPHSCGGAAVPDIGAYEATVFCPVLPPPPVVTPVTTTDSTPAPPPPPPATPAAKDTTKPVLSKLSFHSSHFTVAHHSKLHVTLSEAADVTVSVQVAHHHSHHRPTTYTTVGSTTYHHEKQGADSILISGRVKSKALRHDSYRAVVYATDAAGNVSSHHHLNFSIVSH